MKKEKKIRTILYILLAIGVVLLYSHMEYQQIQEDKQAQKDCRTVDNNN